MVSFVSKPSCNQPGYGLNQTWPFINQVENDNPNVELPGRIWVGLAVGLGIDTPTYIVLKS